MYLCLHVYIYMYFIYHVQIYMCIHNMYTYVKICMYIDYIYTYMYFFPCISLSYCVCVYTLRALFQYAL
jgi:hypothetical protein